MKSPLLLVAFLTFLLPVITTPAASSQVVVAGPQLPGASIELNQKLAPIVSDPWQLPNSTTPNYNAKREADTKDFANTHIVHVFNRGVFVGYTKLDLGKTR